MSNEKEISETIITDEEEFETENTKINDAENEERGIDFKDIWEYCLTIVAGFVMRLYFHCELWCLLVLCLVAGIAIFFQNKVFNHEDLKGFKNGLGIVVDIALIVCIYFSYQNSSCIVAAKSEELQGVSYEELFEIYSGNCIWSCEERKDFTIITQTELMGEKTTSGISGNFEAKVSVWGIRGDGRDYCITFYIREGKEGAVPAKLEINDIDCTENIEEFISEVYYRYIFVRK